MLRQPLRPEQPQMNQDPRLAWILSFVGGFVDTYTFITRGGMFASAQTGNIIFLAANFANGNWHQGFLKAVTILAFWLGTMLAAFWTKLMDHTHYWRVAALIPELIILIILGIVPTSVSNYLVLPPLAVVMAIQNSLYDQVAGVGYANVMATANLKHATLAGVTAFLYHNLRSLHLSLIYTQAFGYFIAGAITCAFLIRLLNIQAIWLPALLVAIAISIHAFLIKQKEKHYQW
ncbi:YoaK family protein [Lentilactobacillus raoultii]|uniref:YoaK family protein n=1 Tax=Lentilactobacillus raoultii TaxID=1987503 RepID=A0ABW3PQ00_9LACO|nr:YoaK family protein [Lentilactobacillus raoultii]